jgi:mannosyl-3-phosphoglycerate phosphatase
VATVIMTTVVFTDLDGSLLDRDTYRWDATIPALEHVERRAVPLVLVTGKTRAEVQGWRQRLGNNHPFVVENGGAVFIPQGYFPISVPGATLRSGYEVVEWGKPYADLIAGLRAASRFTRCRVAAFHEMTAEKVASVCGLAVEEAVLAKQREYDEPFYVVDTERERQLKLALAAQGLRWTHGGRLCHVGGDSDKASGVRLLSALFRKTHERIVTIGLGDSLSDASFLQAVDMLVIVRSRDAAALQSLVPHAMLTWHEGPAGWNEAVLEVLRD